jgi:hypothetical protein
MRIRAGYEISYDCPQPTPMILVLRSSYKLRGRNVCMRAFMAPLCHHPSVQRLEHLVTLGLGLSLASKATTATSLPGATQ